ncbi:hypothetical protein [Streptomyces sp. NPDC058985]|uniref:hypothetical protein n=1 Tax=Streptomyces sp. NPDC058985 TaxID=3346684 RepID=UPI003684449F
MEALSGVRRVWSGAPGVPQQHSTPPTTPRLRAAGGRIGLVVPPQSETPARDTAGADEGAGAEAEAEASTDDAVGAV